MTSLIPQFPRHYPHSDIARRKDPPPDTNVFLLRAPNLLDFVCIIWYPAMLKHSCSMPNPHTLCKRHAPNGSHHRSEERRVGKECPV